MAFNIKSLLTPFYKLVHPDTLPKAPARVKSVNSRALATLNSYIDNYKQGQIITTSSLEFYVPSEISMFRHCKVTLFPLSPKSSLEQRDIHMENTANSILSAIKTPEEKAVPHEAEKLHNRKEKFGQHEKDRIWNDVHREHRLSKKQYLKQAMMLNIEASLYKSHPHKFGYESQNPGMIVSESVSHAVKPAMFEKLEMLGFQLELLYFDKKLTLEQRNEAIKRLSGSYETMQNMFKNLWIFNSMREYGIGIMVEFDFDVHKYPGFVSVPWEFNWKDFNEFYTLNKDKVLIARREYLISKRNNKQSH